jgi:SAM-dependent methyltransferase
VHVGVDALAGDDVDVIADVHELARYFPDPAQHFDAVICVAALEHFRRPWVAAEQIAKVMRPGGLGFFAAPQTFPVHGYPQDYFRFSTEALAELFAPDVGWEVVRVEYAYPCRIVPLTNEIQASGWNFEAPAWLLTAALVRRLGSPGSATRTETTGREPVRVDLGGGRKPKPGFLNVDVQAIPGVDHVVDFEQLGRGVRLPFTDQSVEEVYSSHALEHVRNHHGVLHEIARVCKVGAHVEIRVPHWNGAMALCNGHVCTVSEEQVRHWCQDFIADWWRGSPRRLRLVATEYVPAAAFPEARGAFGFLTDEQVLRFVPGACHEIAFHFEVIPHEDA